MSMNESKFIHVVLLENYEAMAMVSLENTEFLENITRGEEVRDG